jgi:hypothetical protein
LREIHGVEAEFCTLQEVQQRGRIAADNSLVIRYNNNADVAAASDSPCNPAEEFTVSVAYFRAGYAPTDYLTETEWVAREMIEFSSAIKCPNVGYQLTGTKAIQASLCQPGVLEKFLTADEAGLLKRCFAAQYSLLALQDHSAENAALRLATLQAVQQAKADGSQWVLKPQREGGGNNIYNAELSKFLVEHEDDPLLSGWTLFLLLHGLLFSFFVN